MTEQVELSKSYEYLGTWWKASDPKRTHRGVLKLTPNGISLNLDGERNSLVGFLNYNSSKDGPINGMALDGRKFTLTKAFSGGGSFSVQETHKIFSNLCVIGGYFETDANIKFDNLTVYLSQFENWLQFTPFKSRDNFIKGIHSVSFRHPDTLFEIEVQSIPGRIRTAHSMSFSGGFFEKIEWTHLPGITIETNALIDESKLWDLTYSMEQLFSLLLGFPVHPKFINCSNKRGAPELFNIYFSLYGKAGIGSEDYDAYEVIMPLPKIKSKLPKIFNAWFSLALKERPLRHLFSGRFSESGKYTTAHFLNYMQALEIYARINFHKPLMNINKFSKVRAALLSAIPGNISRVEVGELEGKIKNMNQPSLRQRMKELISALPKGAREPFGFDDSYIAKLVNTRNFFTHYSLKPTRGIFSENELMRVIDKLACLLIVVQLRSLGLSPTEVVKRLKRTWRYHFILDGKP
jgi:hypothetical protein